MKGGMVVQLLAQRLPGLTLLSHTQSSASLFRGPEQENEGPEHTVKKLLMGEVSHGVHPVTEPSSAPPPRRRPSSAQQILAGSPWGVKHGW